MSALESSDARGDDGRERGHESGREDVTQFTRWPGLLSLSLGVLLGPTIALINQSAMYAVNMWACGRNLRGTLHIVPFLSLIVIVGTAIAAYINWRAIGRGVEDEHEGIVARVRFLALTGIAVSVFSALVVIAQWSTIFVFAPCMRA